MSMHSPHSFQALLSNHTSRSWLGLVRSGLPMADTRGLTRNDRFVLSLGTLTTGPSKLFCDNCGTSKGFALGGGGRAFERNKPRCCDDATQGLIRIFLFHSLAELLHLHTRDTRDSDETVRLRTNEYSCSDTHPVTWKSGDDCTMIPNGQLECNGGRVPSAFWVGHGTDKRQANLGGCERLMWASLPAVVERGHVETNKQQKRTKDPGSHVPA